MEHTSTMGELAEQAIREGTVDIDGMGFTHYATFERTDPTGHIANYLRKESGNEQLP